MSVIRTAVPGYPRWSIGQVIQGGTRDYRAAVTHNETGFTFWAIANHPQDLHDDATQKIDAVLELRAVELAELILQDDLSNDSVRLIEFSHVK